MSKRMKAAFVCHLSASVLIAALGMIYLLRTQFMPYHAVALGKSWADMDPAFQILWLALMKAFGGATLATAVAMGILLVIPFKRGRFWARWTIPVTGLAAELPFLYATLSVSRHTPATPPWAVGLVIIALLFAGFILSMEKGGVESPS